MTNRVPEGGRSKPDPEQLWRYGCPECGNQVWRSAKGYVYWCRECEESFERGKLRDRKRE